MRVTNSMIYGNSMNNIWRNARHLNSLVTQQETGYRIQRPSDDPLLSARTLRYRTILSEAEQFLRNVHQGTAWMEVSESAFDNILTGTSTSPSLMQRIYTLLVEGAQTGTQTLAEHRTLVAEMRQHFNQMFNDDINQTYLGRFVFSGFHTDQPPVLTQGWPGRTFVIQQNFVPHDVERTKAFHRPTPTCMPQDIWANIIKLPYTNVSFADSGVADVPTVGVVLADGTRLHVETRISTEEDAYSPADFITDADGNQIPVIHSLSDTGELVMSDAVRDLINLAGGINITYQKSDIRAGELNPIVYFPSTEITGGTAVHFNTAGQNIQMEISPNSYISINLHARDILTANLFADLMHLFNFVDNLIESEPTVIEAYLRDQHGYMGDYLAGRVSDFLSDELSMFASAVHYRMNHMLERIQEHTAQAQRQHTNLGTRMARLEMVGIRLEEDEVAYTELLSDVQDADIVEVMRRKESAEIAFNHSLRAIALTTQLSLADFINR